MINETEGGGLETGEQPLQYKLQKDSKIEKMFYDGQQWSLISMQFVEVDD